MEKEDCYLKRRRMIDPDDMYTLFDPKLKQNFYKN